MAKRKINIQRTLGVKGALVGEVESGGAIDKLTESMSTVNMGFRPTDQRVYEINLDRIIPDPTQPRRLLPHDLREGIKSARLSPAAAMRKLVLRAEKNDTVALLILGGKEKGPAGEEDVVIEDTGLLALAQSIREIGLRHPLNVYRIDTSDSSNQLSYRLGEGERRFWAHHLLVQKGYDEFRNVRCIVEVLPDNEETIHQRQEAENAARVDLPAIARARSMQRIKERLTVEMGTRVPGQNTIRLPSQRELQIAVGQRVKSFTGRAIGDRMVRNYMAILNLSPVAQDLAEAAQLTEKQLRPVMRLKTNDEQVDMIHRIVTEKWSGRQVLQEVVTPPLETQSTLQEVKRTTVEQRFEKRILDAAKTMHSLLTLPQQNYEEAITALAVRAKDGNMHQALQSLRQTLEEVLLKVEGFSLPDPVEVTLLSITPPLEGLKHHLPVDKFELIEADVLTGSQILDQLLQWRKEDRALANRLDPFVAQIELVAKAIKAGEVAVFPVVEGQKSSKYPDMIVYKVLSEASIYWAHELLVKRGETRFKLMKAHIVKVTYVEEA